jgi:hypothetical protein
MLPVRFWPPPAERMGVSPWCSYADEAGPAFEWTVRMNRPRRPER